MVIFKATADIRSIYISFHHVCDFLCSVVLCTHVFSADLFLGELHLYQRSDRGQQLPPRPVFHAAILLYVLLDAADGHILDLSHTNTHNIIRQRKKASSSCPAVSERRHGGTVL